MKPGRVLEERYEILQPIAEGGSSMVWEARDARSGGLVAVKAVSLEQAGWCAEVRDRFEKEGHLLELVRHEHLVGVRGRGETDDGFLYLVLDRLRGDTLADRLARPPRLSWREAAAVALDLSRGLAALHAHGIVHRDLKPANVILHREAEGDRPVCKIIDLGISKASAAATDPALFATLTATGQVLGTPEYMSYEQALGERDVDARTDVWALGVMLYEMLAGKRPFQGPHPNAVLAAIRSGPPPALREVARNTPRALVEVVDCCLTRARDARPRDGEALSELLASAIERSDVDDARARRRRWLAIGGSVALAAAGAALAARFTSVGAPPMETHTAPSAAVTAASTVTVAMERPPPAATAEPTQSAATSQPTQTVQSAQAVPSQTARTAQTAQSAAPPSGQRPITRVNSAGF